MEAFFIYLIKVNIALTLFYLLYAIFLKKDTFIGLKRYFFLSVIVFSLVYPALTIHIPDQIFFFRPSVEELSGTGTVDISTVGMIVENAEIQPSSIHWRKILIWSLAIGSILFGFRFLWQLMSIFHIRTKSEKRIVSGIHVYHLTRQITPFSFFKWIFINTDSHSDGELRQILLHEQTHARQWHSADIMLAEMLCIFFWWNPVVWAMKREIAINLEYLADNWVLRKGINSREYQYHLLRLTYHETAVQIVNNFNVSQLKQRIMMMNKTKSPPRKLARYMIVLPFALFCITVNSCTNKKQQSETPETESEVTITVPPSETAQPIDDTEEIFVVVENQPEFTGGTAAMMKFLSENVEYPAIAKENGIQGRVICNFIVEKDGSVSDVQVVRGVDPSIDKEAVRVIQSMPKWTPGKQRGQEVRVRFTLPVVFRLEKSTNASASSYPTTPVKVSNTEEVFVVVENQAEFPGGSAAMMKFISDNVKYPMIAQENGIQGRVIVNFIVEKDGSLSDFKVVNSVDPSLDKEAVRLVESMPKWKPGIQNGEIVRVRYTLPVVFRLQN